MTNRCKNVTADDQPALSALAQPVSKKALKPCPPNQIRYTRTPTTPMGTNRCRKIDTLAADPAIRPHLEYLKQLYSRELQGELVETYTPSPRATAAAASSSASAASVSSTARELSSKRIPCKPGFVRYFKTEKTPLGKNRCVKRENIPRQHAAYIDELYAQELAGRPVQSFAHNPVATSPELLQKIAAVSPTTAKSPDFLSSLFVPNPTASGSTVSSVSVATSPIQTTTYSSIATSPIQTKTYSSIATQTESDYSDSLVTPPSIPRNQTGSGKHTRKMSTGGKKSRKRSTRKY